MRKYLNGVVTSVLMASTLFMSTPFLFADDIFSKGASFANGLYSSVVGISTPIALASIGIALLVSMLSHNQKMVDASRMLAKGVGATWVVLNALVWIFNYVTPYLRGGADLSNLAGK